jgi:predicted PurR-regulated permease PerM
MPENFIFTKINRHPMNQTFRYILIGLGIVLAILTIWYFIHIVAYILISAVIALIGRPLVELLGKIRLYKLKIPKWVRALFTLLLMWVIFLTFFRIVIPLVIYELNDLAGIDTQKVLISLEEPIARLESIIDKYRLGGDEEFTVQQFLTQKAGTILNAAFLSNIFSSFAGALGNIFIAVFAISFISFFFLKDERLFAEGVLSLVPDKHVDAFRHAMNSTRQLLMRYFIGILGQITGIFTLVTTGLTIIGIDFGLSLLIGLIAAIMNVIPYLGPIIGSSIGILIGIATHLDLNFYSELLPLIGLMTLVFIIVQLTDNLVFQPLIFSNSVHAHPLEIFLVILIAGSLAGIAGMILAIPTYTVIRVFAKEFFNNFKVVKKLTKNIR